MEPIMKFRDVERKYRIGDNDFFALKDVNLEIFEGELAVILGPSGAGKSTLLNLIGGMDSPTGGEIIFQGENIAEYSDDELTEYRAQNIGVVFQFYNLIPTLTAYENVALMRDIRGEAIMDPKEALMAVGLGEHLHQFPSQMSGGEQQRTSIARAVAKNPKLLLCDEPTGALDYETGKAILKLLQDTCRKSGMTVVIITHNSALTAMADRVVKIKNGTVASVSINENPESIENIEW